MGMRTELALLAFAVDELFAHAIGGQFGGVLRHRGARLLRHFVVVIVCFVHAMVHVALVVVVGVAHRILYL